MQLTLKTQQLKPLGNTNKHVFATSIAIEPQNKNDISRRGNLFLILDITSPKRTDLETLATIFTDTLKESYYAQDENTPLYAIENALDKAKLNVLSVDERVKNEISLSFCTALIWNRVIYISHTGSPAAYLIRNNGVKDLASTNTNDEIITTSGLLTADDVIIIGTQAFRLKFPPQEIITNLGGISTLINTDKTRDAIAAVIIKASTPSLQSKKHISKVVTKTKLPDLVTAKLTSLKNKLFTQRSLSETYREYQKKKPAPVASISETSNNSLSITSGVTHAQRRRRITRKSAKRRKSAVLGGLVITLAAIVSTMPKHNNKIEKSNIYTMPPSTIQHKSVLGETDDKTNKENGLLKLSSIATNFKPSQGILFNKNTIIILNKKDGSLYKIDTKDKTHQKIDTNANDTNLLACNNPYCFAINSTLIQVFKLDNPQKIDTYRHNLKNIQDIVAYNEELYILTTTDIYSLKIDNKNDAPDKWLNKKESLSKPISITHSSEGIYVLDGRSIHRYITLDGKTGSRRPFEFDNSYLLSPVQIRANNDYIFVLNSDINEVSVVVFDSKTGEFVRKTKLTKRETEANIPFIIPKSNGPDFYYVKNGILYSPTN